MRGHRELDRRRFDFTLTCAKNMRMSSRWDVTSRFWLFLSLRQASGHLQLDCLDFPLFLD